MASDQKQREPKVILSQEDVRILENIIQNTKTKNGIKMKTLLENSSPKNNQLLYV